MDKPYPEGATSSSSLRTAHRFTTPLVSILGPALGGAFMIPHPWIGALLWLGLFQNLRFAAFALFGTVLAEGILRLFQISDNSPAEGNLKANALLSAIAAAWLTEFSGIPVESQIIVVASAVIAVTVLAAAMLRPLLRANLPPLVVSYCMISVFLFAIFPHWTLSAIGSMQWWPVPSTPYEWLITYFRTLGALLFSPTLGIGMIITLAILLWSRLVFLAGTIGWIAGILTAVYLNDQGVLFYWMPTAYNFFLAGAALGAVFFVPSRFSLPLAAVGGAAAALLAAGFQHLSPYTAIGYLPLVSALTIWVAICAQEVTENRIVRRNRTVDLPPEAAWQRLNYWSRRSGDSGPFLIVPLCGKSRIAQGEDGQLSHVGPWRHALDFQLIPVAEPGFYDGMVMAPAGGFIERIHDGVSDNPVGVCNYAENWGNYVMIRLDQGGWALLAHLQQGSIVVSPGMRVEVGAFVGRIGNSGRSPTPHLHLQCQSAPELSAPTQPFRLANFLCAQEANQPFLHWHSAAMPSQGALVSPALNNPTVQTLLASAAPGVATWNIETDGVVPKRILRRQGDTERVSIRLDPSGQHILHGERSGALIVEIAADAWRVNELQKDCSPLLWLLALAVPSVPYAATPGMKWDDLVPLLSSRLSAGLASFVAPYLSAPFVRVRCHCTTQADNDGRGLTVISEIETPLPGLPSRLHCRFDRLCGPVYLQADFPHGSITYSLLSFEPGLPFDH
ncbi:urea transporter [Stutzerimonas stutzeri]|uniref:urea transporter n=1 Tax=Stutzerimonas sp. S1 TaxID=3030652 RepID=UPI0022245DF4|nr:urea transporter [Stutzerimonas sp. S1]MCW3149324.1 urea transporter [Stutzerimonas sp. S1]